MRALQHEVDSDVAFAVDVQLVRNCPEVELAIVIADRTTTDTRAKVMTSGVPRGVQGPSRGACAIMAPLP